MAYDKIVDSVVLDTGLTEVAVAIRSKTGASLKLQFPDEMINAINGIATRKPEETKTVKYTTNGKKTVTPTNGKVMTAVNVEVAVPTPPPVIQSKTITSNGTYIAPSGIDGFSPVNVNCPKPKPEQSYTKVYTSNGTYPITPDSGKVINGGSIKVETPAPKAEQVKTIDVTANGTVSIKPDVGKVLSEAIAKVNVPTGGGGGETCSLKLNGSDLKTGSTVWYVNPAGELKNVAVSGVNELTDILKNSIILAKIITDSWLCMFDGAIERIIETDTATGFYMGGYMTGNGEIMT